MAKERIGLRRLATTNSSLAAKSLECLMLGASTESLVVLIHLKCVGRVMIGALRKRNAFMQVKERMPCVREKAQSIS